MGIQVASIPQQKAIAARPRREGLYDTEGWNDAVAVVTLTQFIDPRSFAVASLTQTKQNPRDTNLIGAGSIPKAWHLFWFGLRQRIATLQANMATAANVVISEEVNRIRELCGWEFFFGTTPYISGQLTEIPCVLPQAIHTTHTAATVMVSGNAARDRRNIYDVSIDRMPIEVTEIEAIRFRTTPQAATLPSPTVETYLTTILVGTLLKGLSG